MMTPIERAAKAHWERESQIIKAKIGFEERRWRDPAAPDAYWQSLIDTMAVAIAAYRGRRRRRGAA